MKIHGYHVVPRGAESLTNVLDFIESLPLRKRLRSVSNSPMRLEYAFKSKNFWQLDFSNINRKGPGRASPDHAITDFELEDEEGFAEETAALYHPASGFMMLQYNHYGPRNTRIQKYLHSMARSLAGKADAEELPDEERGFDLNPLLTAAAADMLDNYGFVKSISASFHVPGVLARPESSRKSLGGLLDMPLMGGAQKVRIAVSAGGKKGAYLSKKRVVQAVRDLLSSKQNVSDLVVVAKESEDSPREPIDFFEARLEAERSVVLDGRRLARKERLGALRDVFQTWRDEKLLNVE